MSEKNDKSGVVLTQEEIDKITKLIKSGKTLKEIGDTISPRRRRRSKYDIEMAEAEARAKYSTPKIEVKAPPFIDKVDVNIQQDPTISVAIDILVDNKRISLGATRPIDSKKRLVDAHEELYAEIILSMDNLISLVNESKK